MEKQTTTTLNRYLDKKIKGRWLDAYFAWDGHVCATDGLGAIAIPGAGDAPPGPEKGVALVFRESGRLDTPLMFRISDIEEALKRWPIKPTESGVLKKVEYPMGDEYLIALEVGDGIVSFHMTQMKRLCQTAKTLKCQALTLTHAMKADGESGCGRGLLGAATVVIMPFLCADENQPIRVASYEATEWDIEGWRVIKEGGVLVGYKSSRTGIERVVSNTTNPDEFRRQVTRPKKAKVAVEDKQVSLLDLIDQA